MTGRENQVGIYLPAATSIIPQNDRQMTLYSTLRIFVQPNLLASFAYRRYTRVDSDVDTHPLSLSNRRESLCIVRPCPWT